MNTTDLQAFREFWNRKASKEPLREQQDPNKTIHTDLLWRLIKRHLPAAGSPVLDAGGGTGRFSFRLAELGFPTTHLDLSPEMLDIAKREATDRNMKNLDFVEGSITDLSRLRYNPMLWNGTVKERILRCSLAKMKQGKEYAHGESKE